MSLKGKTAIVTGGSRGIGRAIVLDLVASGASVLFTYLKSAEAASRLEEEMKRAGGEARAFRADSKDYADAKKTVDEAVKTFGGVDILVNNAGVVKDKALMFMEPSEWQEVIETNLTGYFNMARSCIVSMMKQKSGNIINISSVAGVVGTARQANYSSAKAGILGLTKSLAKEVGPYNIRVNAVAPGYIETDMTKDLKGRDKLEGMIPSGRFGRPEDVARAVTFLAGDSSSYITGQVIKVDGGLAI
ncbi:MAG TPA: 3-oxoacyl-[acyl-carrier-protein] reductase [Candidatus Omnitrophota bacterium]|nr:3-oxoacyl-[acyl-carrier-protein] reductase [Candidatus Omnitrophota bacterium]